MNELSLTRIEAPVESGPRFDWKLPVVLVVMNIVAIGIQWGVMSDRIEAAMKHQEQQDRHMELIDSELKESARDAGEVKEFRQEANRRFDVLDRKIDGLEGKH